MKRHDIYPKNYIRELRNACGWTLRDLEEKTGWSNQTLSNLELSKADLTWSKMLKLADVFGCLPIRITEKPTEPLTSSDKNQEEKELLRVFRGFSKREQHVCLDMIKTYMAARVKSVKSAKTGHRRDQKTKNLGKR